MDQKIIKGAFPRVYRINRGMRVPAIIVASVVLPIFSIVLISIFYGKIKHPEISLSINTVVLIVTALLIIVITLLLLISTKRRRLVIEENKLIEIGSFSRLELSFSEIEGYAKNIDIFSSAPTVVNFIILPKDESKKAIIISDDLEKFEEITIFIKENLKDLGSSLFNDKGVSLGLPFRRPRRKISKPTSIPTWIGVLIIVGIIAVWIVGVNIIDKFYY